MSKISVINVANFDSDDIVCMTHPKALGVYATATHEFDVTLKSGKNLCIKSKSGNDEDLKRLYKIFTLIHNEWKGVDDLIIINPDENEENSEEKK